MTAWKSWRLRLAGQVTAGAVVAVAGLTLAACSGPNSASPTAAAPVTSTSVGNAPASSVANLPMTDAVRARLVAARAAQIGVAPSTFSGLAPGDTYYAFDPSTNTYWAAARMALPSSGDSSPGTDFYKAGVAGQDDGSYLVFTQPRGGMWTVTTVGASGPHSPCPLTVPPGVVTAWGWPLASCRPAGI
jgi:hypothetical protein